MMARRRWPICGIWLVMLFGLGACADAFERFLANRVDRQIAGGDVALHTPIADLHADSLMWARDLTQDGTGRGHADLPRLAAGGVVLQVFTVFTVTPSAASPCLSPATGGGVREGCADGASVNLTALMNLLVHGRLTEAFSVRRTVERRAAAFHDLVRRSQDTPHPLLAIRQAADLRELVAQRRAGRPVIGAVLGLEGAHPLADDSRVSAEAEVGWLHDLGYRLVGITHRFDNTFAGSSEGVRAGGLTPAGEALARAALARGMALDAAHMASPALQALARLVDRPLIYSHGGIATNCTPPHGAPAAPGSVEDCDADRNLTPADAVAIARTGGLIGVGYWPEAVGRRGIPSIVAAMERIIQALSAGDVAAPLSHIAIGSDFDGFVKTAVDASGHPRVLAAVEDRFGWGSARMIGWVNACRALARALDGPRTDVAFCDDLP